MTAHRAAAVLTMPASLRCRRRVSLLPRLLYVPAMQPLHSPRAGAHPLLHLDAIVPSAVLHNRHWIHRRSSALRDTHPKLTTALSTTRHSTTDRSSGRSPTTPLRSSCRECLHAHRCLRSSSISATTPWGPHRRTNPLRPVNRHPQPAGHAVTVELVRPTVDAVDSPTPVRTPLFWPQNWATLDTNLLLLGFPASPRRRLARIDRAPPPSAVDRSSSALAVGYQPRPSQPISQAEPEAGAGWAQVHSALSQFPFELFWINSYQSQTISEFD
jgi:hypothetical protein